MFEIIVGFIALVVLYRIFPGKNNSTGSNDTILPFLEDDRLDDNKQKKGDYYDWAEDIEDDIESNDADHFEDAGDDYFEK